MRFLMMVIPIGAALAACGGHGEAPDARATVGGAAATMALTDAEQPLAYNPSGPCPDPTSMPADYPPYDGTPFTAVGDLHDAAGPNLETTGFRIDYQANGKAGSAEIDLRTLLKLDPQQLYDCGLLLDNDPNHHHMVAAAGTVASACGTFLRRRKIVVADRLVDLQPNATVLSEAGCAELALQAVGTPASP